jgi:hypothetical protein
MGTVSGGSGGAEDRNGAPVLRRVRPLAAAIWARLRKYSAHALVVAVVSAAVPVLLNTALSEDDRPPACPGAGCDGRNPQKEGCAADALSWHPASANPGALQVRYSKHCGALWARILHADSGDQLTLRGGRSEQTAIVNYGHDQFTPMVSVGKHFKAEACAVPSASENRPRHWQKYCIAVTERTPWGN